ncbi:hypothetical protein D3C80_510690 [compost metagenome]
MPARTSNPCRRNRDATEADTAVAAPPERAAITTASLDGSSSMTDSSAGSTPICRTAASKAERVPEPCSRSTQEVP